MISPRSKLIFGVAVLLLPAALVIAVLPEMAALAGLFAVVLVMLAVVDAIWGYSRMDGLQIELPDVLRLSKDRAGDLEIRIRNNSQRQREIRLGIAFPPTFHSEKDALPVALPAGSEWSRLKWPVTPSRRGNYSLNRVNVECSSPLGLWAIRAQQLVQCEMRVYPNLMPERKNLAALFLHRGGLGIHSQRMVGKGRDFEKLREYIPGDSYDEIHWKATAKRGKPVTKVFQVERTQEIYVIIDASRLSARLTRERTETILERYVTAALTLGMAAERQGDLFGLLTFTHQTETFIRASSGKAHYQACRDALYTLHAQEVTPDFDEVAAFIRLRLRRRALLLFLTALDDSVLAESFTRNLTLLSRQHLVFVNMLRPDGAQPLFTQPNTASMDDLYRSLGGHMRWQNLRELEKVLQRRGVRFALLDQEKLCVELVTQYLGMKQRQLL